MRYTVTWRTDQKEKLARIWIASSKRALVSAATNEIDSLLAENPEAVGEDFYGDYLMAVPPLAVVYAVSRDDRIVQVIAVYHQGQIGE